MTLNCNHWENSHHRKRPPLNSPCPPKERFSKKNSIVLYPLQERYELGRSTLIQGGDQELARTLTDVLIDSPPPICTSQGAFTFPESSAGL